jgi:hypothetical protein
MGTRRPEFPQSGLRSQSVFSAFTIVQQFSDKAKRLPNNTERKDIDERIPVVSPAENETVRGGDDVSYCIYRAGKGGANPHEVALGGF